MKILVFKEMHFEIHQEEGKFLDHENQRVLETRKPENLQQAEKG